MDRRTESPAPPDQTSRGLVNLVAELEHRAAGSAPSGRLAHDLASAVPAHETVVLVLFDGLGVHQLDHPAADDLRASAVGMLDAPFPTTTTVSLATIASGRVAAEHGLLGYLLSVPEVGTVVNTIHMRSVWGDEVAIDHAGFLPGTLVWERLRAAGVEALTVQPGGFAGSPLSRTLYRDLRFEPYFTVDEAVAVTTDVASHPRRFVFLYVPFVDLAAHMHGQTSREYDDAMGVANAIWRRLVGELPDGVTLVGTADHGHVDIPRERRIRLTEQDEAGLQLAGDARGLFVTGDPAPVLARLPSQWVPVDDMHALWGGPVADRFADRLPDGMVVPDPGWVVLARFMNQHLIGHHGGLTPQERQIPLLVRP